MKFNPIASAVIALAAVTTPTMMFGAAADLTDCCTPADKDQPEGRRQLRQPELFVAEPDQQGEPQQPRARPG
jgi:hypothetical protein